MNKEKENTNYKRQNLEEDTVNMYDYNQVTEGTNYRRHDLEDDAVDTDDDAQDTEKTNPMYQDLQENKDTTYDNEKTNEATNLNPQNRDPRRTKNYAEEETNLNPQNRDPHRTKNYAEEETNLNPQNRDPRRKPLSGNDDTNEATELNRRQGEEDTEATELNRRQGEEDTEGTELNRRKEEEITEYDNLEQDRQTDYGPKHQEQPAPEEEFILNKCPESDAKLVWRGLSLTGRKKYILREGKNYIGRNDEDMPADLSLKDEYASARSICIDVKKRYSERGEDYYEYILTIERAKNSVLVCGTVYPVGSTIKLRFNDTIVLGKTTLTLKKVKK